LSGKGANVDPDPAEPSAYARAQAYLFGLKSGGPRYGIDRMRLLSEALGHPERAVPCVHIAGTNGKGSTAALLESIVRSAGWRVGLYTSPHLVRLGERVQVDRRPLSDPDIAAFVEELRPAAERVAARGGPDLHPTFFEFMTAMAFLRFARARCDLAVVEVGLGGRLDATNIVEPEVCAITSIGLDHCEYLGDTIPQIAAEKAGIIKPGVPVVIGRMPPDAEATIRRIAGDRGSRVVSVAEEFGEDIGGYPRTSLAGDYQRWNAATASLVARLLPERFRLTLETVSAGLAAADWPGRWQRSKVGERTVIFDASHNPEGASVLDTNLGRLVSETGRKPVVVAGALGQDRGRALLAVVCRHARELHLAVPNQSRALSHAELVALVPPWYTGRVVRSTVEGLFPGPGLCRAGDLGDVVVVTGSIYLVGEVLARLEPSRGPDEGRLQDF
jgi:dihydrofolate synthase/folylpolyglutamate synthase